MTERRRDLDIAKGIGIILVVWAHACAPFGSYIEQWHMPYFFFISGMLYSGRNVSGKEYIWRKCKSLLFPFWWWNLLLFPLFFLLYYWGNWSSEIFFKNILNIVLTLDKVPFLGATWFLASLFWVSILSHLIIGTSDSKYVDVFLLLAGALLGWYGLHTILPYRINRTLVCAMFYINGYLYNKYCKNVIPDNMKNVFAFLCGGIYIITANGDFVFLANITGDYNEIEALIFIIRALAMIFFTLRLSNWLDKCTYIQGLTKHLEYLGKNSMCIVIWQFLAFRAVIILQIVILGADISSITAFPVYDASGGWWILYLIAGIYISLGWQYILKHNPCSKIMGKLQ